MVEIITGIGGAALVGAIGWVVQRALVLATRVTVLETKQEDLPKLINMQFDNMNRRLERIERHVLNGHYKEDQ